MRVFRQEHKTTQHLYVYICQLYFPGSGQTMRLILRVEEGDVQNCEENK